MRKNNFIIFAIVLAFLSSCNSNGFQEHEIGDSLIDKSTEVLLIDTFTIESSTVKLDSVRTSGFNNVLVGQYQDPYFGEISSDFYGVVNLGNSFSLVASDNGNVPVKFDSLVFIGYLDENPMRFIGDSLLEQSIAIHRVIEKIELADNKFTFKDHDVFDYESETLGDTTIILKPITHSIYSEENDNDPESNRGGLRFRMKDKLGLDIINLVNNSNDSVIFSNIWEDYFKGIVLKPGVNTSAMFSFQTGNSRMKLRLYYSDSKYENVGVVQFHDFPINNGSLNFTNNKSDFNSTNGIAQMLGQIEDEKQELSSDKTNQLAFIQGSLGFMTKIKIPYIDELNILGLTGGILNAELRFYPKDGSYDNKFIRLPDHNTTPFHIYPTNDDNMTVDPLQSTATRGPVLSQYIVNTENPDESYYSFDITSYINNILLQGQKYEDALLITLPIESKVTPNVSPGHLMDRLVIDNDKDSDFRIRLRTTYVKQR